MENARIHLPVLRELDPVSPVAANLVASKQLVDRSLLLGKRCRVKDTTRRYLVFNLLPSIFTNRCIRIISPHLFSLACWGWGLGAQFLGVIKY